MDMSKHKKIWIPPPAKTTIKKKILKSPKILQNHGTKVSKPCYDTLDDSVQVILHKKQSVEVQTNSVESNGSVQWNNVPSISKSHDEKELPSSTNPYTKYRDLMNQLKSLRMHYQSLKVCMELLSNSKSTLYSIDVIDKTTIQSMLSQTDKCIREFETTLNELDDFCITFDMQLCTGNKGFDEILAASMNAKDSSICNLLASYDSLISCFKFIVEMAKPPDLSEFHHDQEEMRLKIEDFKKHVTLSDAQLQESESQLHILEDQITVLNIQNTQLEEKLSRMQRELQYKDTQIERMNIQLKAPTYNRNGVAENEKLIEIIEEQKSRHDSEKATLKKALKMQKIKTVESERKVESLKRSLDEKEHALYDIANDRDKWKAQLTSLSNKLVISETRIEDLNTKNWDLMNKMKDLDPLYSDLEKMKSALEEKTSLFNDVEKENELLKATVRKLERTLNKTALELKEKDVFTQCRNENSVKMNSENENQILCILEQIKDHILLQTKDSGQGNLDSKKKKGDVAKDLVNLVSEVRDHFADVNEKQKHSPLMHENAASSIIKSMEKQIQQLQDEQRRGFEDKQRLLERMEQLEENRKKNYANQSMGGKSHVMYSENSFQEQEQRLRLLNLEEKLKVRNLELATLSRKQSETEKKCHSQIKDLQDNLDRANTNNENLQKYLSILKSSYANVFSTS